jgi:soluble lytic murein transglycosylase
MKKILIALFILTGCSSKPINPLPAPSYERLRALKDNLSGIKDKSVGDTPAEVMAQKYMTALKAEVLGNKADACKLFDNLADNEYFPLNQTALVHTLSDCTYSAYELKNLWKQTVVASYLKENYLEISLPLAEKFNLEEFIAEFSYELSTYKKIQSEKVKLLKNAISISQKLNMPDKEDKYFQKLTEVSPMNLKIMTKKNSYSIAKDFEVNRQFEKARDLYIEIINGDYSLEEKVKAYNAYRISFKVERNLKMFLDKTGEMELYLRQLLEENPENTKNQEAWVDAKINYARAIWTEHMNTEARAILDDILEKKIGNNTQLATIYWIYGSLNIESKENVEALAKFEKASEYKISTLDLQENIHWAVVWNKYLLKKYPEVLIAADKFVKKSSNPNFIHKLNFWKAKTLEKLKRKEEADELFKLTMKNDSFGYYGLLAAMETRTPLESLATSEVNTDPIGNIILDWLIAVDEKMIAIKVLKEINPQFKTYAQRERAMSLYALTGWYQGGMLQIYNFPMKMRDELTKKYISVIFPTPYQDIFLKYSKKFKVPEAYPLAITRQESAFNPNIRSWADAFGLMQMIPEKGIELSKKYKIPYKDFNDLYNPDMNIEMGTVLLSELRSKFKGKFAQSTAAYNASKSVITTWEKERFNGDYLEFIEMIPYEETRNYIKLVFRNYMTYKRILEKKEVLIPQNFFETIFN